MNGARRGAIILAIMGVFFVVLGVLIGTGGGDEPVTVKCGGDVMRPGDTCLEIQNGNKQYLSYQDMKGRAENSPGPWIAVVGGVVCFGLAGMTLVQGRTRSRTEQAALESARQWMEAPNAA